MNCIDQEQQDEMNNLSELYTLLDTINPGNLSSGSINILLSIESDGGTAGSYARGLLVFNNIVEYNEPVFMPEPLINNKNIKTGQENNEKHLKVYPNPAGDYIYAEYKLPEESKDMLIKVININGQVEKTIKLKYAIDNKLLNLAGLSNGNCMIILEADGNTISSKAITIVK